MLPPSRLGSSAIFWSISVAQSMMGSGRTRFRIHSSRGIGEEPWHIGGCAMPPDSVDGVDPDVLKAAKALRIELLRWPGGNFVSGYHWRDGVGPREQRPTVPNPAWGGLETHHFGTDEFMAFCRRIAAKPQIA